MDYKDLLVLAGATVKKFKRFGSYQGDWYALVDFRGRTGWVRGSYGSCSGCDAIKAEFEFHGEDYHAPFDKKDCEVCKTQEVRAKGLGEEYLDDIMTQEQAEILASENIEWDTDEPLIFVKKHRIPAEQAGSKP